MAKNNSPETIYVYAYWVSSYTPALLGTLNVNISRGQEIFSFEYSKEWLGSGFAQVLDPDLNLYSGQQYIRDDKVNFGLFLDSSPDRWGRLLMRRGMVTTAEFIKCKLRKFDIKLGETVKEGVYFYGKQTSVADSVAFQTNKGAIEVISNPLEGMDSVAIQFDLYTTSLLKFGTLDEVDIGNLTYTIDSVSRIKDTVYSINNFRTGKGEFPSVIRLR